MKVRFYVRQLREQLFKEVGAFLDGDPVMRKEQSDKIIKLFNCLPTSQQKKIFMAIKHIAGESLPSTAVTQVIGVHVNAVMIAADRLGTTPHELIKEGRAQLERQTPEELMRMCEQILEGQQG